MRLFVTFIIAAALLTSCSETKIEQVSPTAALPAQTVMEVPTINKLVVDAIPAETNFNLINTSAEFNGEAGLAFDYLGPHNNQKSTVRFYIQNNGKKMLRMKLISPLENNWIETSVHAGRSYGAEMEWGKDQVGKWIVRLGNDDGSVGHATMRALELTKE